MKYFIILVTIFITGCSAVKYSPEMKSELSKEGFQYLSERELIVVAENKYNFNFSEWYSYKYIDDPLGTITIIETNKQGYYEGFQCFEPMLFVLTLGIIPTHCVGKFDLVVTIEKSGKKRTITKKIKETSMGGWFPLLLLPLKRWEWDTNTTPYERAFVSVINDEAGKQ